MCWFTRPRNWFGRKDGTGLLVERLPKVDSNHRTRLPSPVRAGIMQSPTSLTCRPLRLFGAAALHNRALRIIRILQLFAKRGVRKGDSAGTSSGRPGPRPPERPTLGPASNSNPPRRPSAKTPACRHQQIRNRPPLANRPDLRPSHPGVKLTLNQVRPDDLTHPSRKLTVEPRALRFCSRRAWW